MDKLIKRALRRDADAFTELMQAQMQSMYKTGRCFGMMKTLRMPYPRRSSCAGKRWNS